MNRTWACEALHSSVMKLHNPGKDNLRAAERNNSSAFWDKAQQIFAAYTPRRRPWPCALFAPLFSTISARVVSLDPLWSAA